MPDKLQAAGEALRQELLAMADDDLATRARLAADGSLQTGGYHPEMEAVHNRNAARLELLLAGPEPLQGGWPARTLVGDDGAAAAWLILQHAIGRPALQRRGLDLLRQAVASGEVAPDEVARLEDRIRIFEGRPQLYGTHFDWDADGRMSPLPIEEPEGLEERRAAVGLPTLRDHLALVRASTRVEGERAPTPPERAAREAEFRSWAERTGWRERPPVRQAPVDQAASTPAGTRRPR